MEEKTWPMCPVCGHYKLPWNGEWICYECEVRNGTAGDVLEYIPHE